MNSYYHQFSSTCTPLCLLIPISVFKASHFNTDVVNRAGFSKLFMDHSDKMWARGKVDITSFTHYPNFAISSLIRSAAFLIFS